MKSFEMKSFEMILFQIRQIGLTNNSSDYTD